MAAHSSVVLPLFPPEERGVGRPRLVPPAPEPSLRQDFLALRESLSKLTGEPIRSGTELVRTLDERERPRLATTVHPLDQILHGGLQKGKLTEISGARSVGRFAVVLAILAGSTSRGEASALVDLGDHLDPAMAERVGIHLPRLLWVRPESTRDATTATEMAITTGFSLVVLDLGLRLKGRRVSDTSWIRLARAAERHGTALVISSPFSLSGGAAEAVVSMRNARVEWLGRGHAPRLLRSISSELRCEKLRGSRPGESRGSRFRMQETIE